VVKLMLLLFLDNVASERELMRVTAMRLDYRWFLGYDLPDAVPHHSASRPRSKPSGGRLPSFCSFSPFSVRRRQQILSAPENRPFGRHALNGRAIFSRPSGTAEADFSSKRLLQRSLKGLYQSGLSRRRLTQPFQGGQRVTATQGSSFLATLG